MSVQQAEITYYDEQGVLVTNARAVLGGTTYPLANITSVSVGRHVPSMTPTLAMFALAGLSLLFWGGTLDFLSKAGVLFFGVLGIIAFMQSRNVFYYVKIGTAGGEQRAMQLHSKEAAEKIVAALNEAIIKRG